MPDGQPNYLQTDSAGKVTAIFSGGISIEELRGTALFQGAKNGIQWTEGPGGAVVANIFAAGPDAASPGINYQSQWNQMDPSNPSNFANITLNASQQEIRLSTRHIAGLKLIDDNGGSSFVKNGISGGNGGATITGGRGVVNFAASNFSNLVNVNHNLGPTYAPALVLACHTSSGSGVGFSIGGFNNAIFTCQGWFPFGTLNQNISFDWLAVGFPT